MSDVDKVEFASPAWLAAIDEILRKELDGVDLGGQSFTISEEFTDPPAHLLHGGQTTVGWHLRVSDDGVEVHEGALADADLRTTVDYQAVLPVARLVYGTTEEAIAEALRIREEARSTGARVGDESQFPPQLMERLFRVHNEIAVRTL
jgi:hypothetical protein